MRAVIERRAAEGGGPCHIIKEEEFNLYEYQVLSFLQLKECEEALNRLAEEGWRLAAMCPNLVMSMGVIVTLEREIKN